MIFDGVLVRIPGLRSMTHGLPSFLAILLCAAGILVAGPADDTSEPRKFVEEPLRGAANPRLVRQLIVDLDSAQFERRDAAYLKLLELGERVIPELAEAAHSRSAEVRFRARRIITLVHERALIAAFRKLSEQEDGSLDIEHGMWLIGRILDPSLRQSDASRQIDDLAERVRGRLEPIAPRDSPPREVVQAIHDVLFRDFGLQGNVADYENPDNSSFDRVLRTRRGLPILLSQIVVAVARRLEVPIVGVPTPGRYIVKYDGAKAPGGPQPDIYLNPFDRGKSRTLPRSNGFR